MSVQRARIIATKVSAVNLRPGDLYSDKNGEHWNRAMSGAGMIPTAWVVPNNHEFESNEIVYRLTIVVSEGQTETRNAQQVPGGLDPHSPPGVEEWELGRIK
jgi:hypothetical protein